MKQLLILLFLLPFFTQAQSWKDLKKAAEKVNKELINKGPFSEEEAVNALKETLNKGTEKGVRVLSVKNGYFANPKITKKNFGEIPNRNFEINIAPRKNNIFSQIFFLGKV